MYITRASLLALSILAYMLLTYLYDFYIHICYFVVIEQITQMLILKNLKMKMLFVHLHICLTSLRYCLTK